IYPLLKEHADIGLTILQAELAKQRAKIADAETREKLAKRQANAAVAVWRLAEPASVLPRLKHSQDQDPTLRSHLIERLGPMGAADAWDIVNFVDAEPDASIHRALILSLGGFKDKRIGERMEVIKRLSDLYEDADAGTHAAAEYALQALG